MAVIAGEKARPDCLSEICLALFKPRSRGHDRISFVKEVSGIPAF